MLDMFAVSNKTHSMFIEQTNTQEKTSRMFDNYMQHIIEGLKCIRFAFTFWVCK